MKIGFTALILGLSIVALPIAVYYFGTAPGEQQWMLLRKLVWMMLGSALLCFITSELSRNYSQVDKIWSLIPLAYVWFVTVEAEYNARMVCMAILVSLWGIRLTGNFALKGAYRWKFWEGEEDYRWKILRQKPEFNARWKWTLFNFGFISIYQNALILLFCLPIVVAHQYQNIPWSILDSVAAVLMFSFIVLESIADLQQWKFQSEKWRLIRAEKVLSAEYQKGFLSSGLWSISRHPNYLAEQSIWICFYLFSVAASGSWFNWSITGCILLVLLFQGSAQFSEEISASKYPLYKEYQKKVGKFLPRII